jgi:hypothetical protein
MEIEKSILAIMKIVNDEEFKNLVTEDDKKNLILHKITFTSFKKETSFDLSTEIRQKCNTIILKQASGTKKREKKISAHQFPKQHENLNSDQKCKV